MSVSLAAAPSHAATTNEIVSWFTNVHAMLSATLAYSSNGGFDVVAGQDRLRLLPPGFIAELVKELRSDTFRELVTQRGAAPTGRVPAFRTFVCEMPDRVWIQFLTETASGGTETFLRFKGRAQFYADAMFEGHGSNYIRCAIEESEGTNYVLPLGFPAELKKTYWIPSKWIQRLDHVAVAYANGRVAWSNSPGSVSFGGRSYWLVVDGPFAWLYDDTGWRWRRDAKEYDPKLKVSFEAAREEARRALASPIPLGPPQRRAPTGIFVVESEPRSAPFLAEANISSPN
jgi:hypothetical protein